MSPKEEWINTHIPYTELDGKTVEVKIDTLRRSGGGTTVHGVGRFMAALPPAMRAELERFAEVYV